MIVKHALYSNFKERWLITLAIVLVIGTPWIDPIYQAIFIVINAVLTGRFWVGFVVVNFR